MSWIDVGALNDIPVRGARIVKTPLGCVALFRTDEEEVFATSDRCPHKGGPLSEGIVHGKSVTCPLHNWVFSLESGEAQGADDGQIATFSVKVEDGRILMDGEELGKRSAA
ncbi:Assimilatory nitrite reductase [NAD(P)H] small subunit [Tritonibacter multivorans]|uniref:Assimilatory nitrite reductase [NAD(P)H] small subunit n=1 Tax=Tritonibacter multivorans TaxID=928856 RepID=A0A0P1G650_9RHOB|nr:nitrite reductase small subunit NirD [Tritonibacter multivorans]MDA7422643.1 nitrite reductase small subunit NirD [Tritonibacter multivorans]CUH77148.1 Assimilatory nitrite reductase [NAD(P)H] small subunit [Tritonibacter multivorans]SFD51321.1 nitrite reductase (NADH) small subunit [Tritonibacter multivorans]